MLGSALSSPVRGTGVLIILVLAVASIASGWTSVAAQSPEPELEYGPLVTIRPIAAAFMSSPYELADGMALGSADAPVVVEVWEDFQCPFCQRFAFEVEPGIVERYVKDGDVRLVFRNLAFLGDESQWAAVAASLAADQNRFWQYHDHLFSNLQGENVGSYSLDRLVEIAEVSGLDMEAFRAGMRLDEARERFRRIDEESRRDASRLGIAATPTVVVDGVALRSPDFETVSAAIDAALEAQGSDAVAEAAPSAGPG